MVKKIQIHVAYIEISAFRNIKACGGKITRIIQGMTENGEHIEKEIDAHQSLAENQSYDKIVTMPQETRYHTLIINKRETDRECWCLPNDIHILLRTTVKQGSVIFQFGVEQRCEWIRADEEVWTW